MKRSSAKTARQFFRSLDRIRQLDLTELEEVSAANIARAVCARTHYPAPLILVPLVDALRGGQ